MFVCESCWATWLPQGEVAPKEETEESSLGRALLYGISLPERALRSTVGLAAGTVSGTAAFLVPQCFQSSKTYEIVVKNSLRLLSEDIGGVERQKGENDEPLMEDYIARKTVGNFVDLAGLATLHLSPLWLLAIVSDVAYSSKTFVLELAQELEREGLIDDASTVHHVDDILDAVQKSTGSAATMFDTPPLNVDELKKSLKETKETLSKADVSTLLPESELKGYWAEMKALSNQEDVSLLGLSGAMTLHTIRRVGSVGQGTLTGVRVAGGLLNKHILGHYSEAISEYHERGFYTALREDSQPYIHAVWNNFSPERGTWTEEIVTGRAVGKLFGKIRGLFRKKEPESIESPTGEPGESN